MRSWVPIVLLGVWLADARAAPPNGYACAPGTVNKGIGCTCPQGYRERRDAEQTATCVTAPPPSASAQFITAVTKGDLVTAKTLVTKYDFTKETKALDALLAAFQSWVKSVKDKTAVMASRGQCKAIDKIALTGTDYIGLFYTFATKLNANDKTDQALALKEPVMNAIEPIFTDLGNCISSASKDDGKAAIAAARDAHRAGLDACFIDVPTPRSPLTAKIVVDAEGAVAETTITVTWPDLDVQLVNKKLEMMRQREIEDREVCFSKEIAGWTFKPNPRGFAATIEIKR